MAAEVDSGAGTLRALWKQSCLQASESAAKSLAGEGRRGECEG